MDMAGRYGTKTILWCANDNLQRFLSLHNNRLPKNSVIVDSDPGKRKRYDAITVFQPDEVRDHIVDSEMIAIFSDINAEAILEDLGEGYGKTFAEESVLRLKIHYIC